MIEVCSLPKSSNTILVRLWKNDLPVALRYVALQDTKPVYPTVSLFSNSSYVECELIPPNMIVQLPAYFVGVFLHISSHLLTSRRVSK